MTTPQGSFPATSRRLVIVEDESILALDIERSLKAQGYDVRGVAADADDALELVARERPDLVLMDIRLQGSIDGIEAASRIKQLYDVPFVYLTAHSDAQTIARAQATEPMGYLLKPFKKPDLTNAVSIALARSASERQLRAREQFLEATLASIGEAIISTDGLGSVTYVNRAAEELLGRRAHDALQQPLQHVVSLERPEGGPLPQDPLSVAHEQAQARFEANLSGPDGVRTVAGTATPVVQGEEKLGVVLALRDVTELLRTRQQLEFSDRLASLGTLAAGVAHEVNNPLSVVISNVGYALETTEREKTDTWEALTDARDAAHRVAAIVDGLRSYSRPHVEKLTDVDPREALGAALHLTHAQWRSVAGIRVDFRPVPHVMASPARLVQVAVTLIINAAQAMEGQRGPHLITLSSAVDVATGHVLLRVADNGPGVPPEVRSRIFDPFFTTKAPGKGTGLGLSIARSIVEHHGGVLSLHTAPDGHGAVFTVSLTPVVAAAHRREVPPLDAWWVGPATPESEALCPGRRIEAGGGPASLGPALGAEVIFLHMPAAEAARLREQVPELETRSILVWEDEPPTGMRSLVSPFDEATVLAIVRRGDAANRRAR